MIARFASLVAIVSLLAACGQPTGRYLGYVGPGTAAPQAQAPTKITVVYPRSYPVSGAFDLYQDDRLVGEIRPGEYLTWETSVAADGRLFIAAKENLVGNASDMAIVRPIIGSESFLELDVDAGLIGNTTSLLQMSQEDATASMSRGTEKATRETNATPTQPARLGK